jgi:3-oxoacyl-(acyl-carrier-protein) synthase
LDDAGGVCRQTVETESLAEGSPRIAECACTYATVSGRISISYLGAGTLFLSNSFGFGGINGALVFRRAAL